MEAELVTFIGPRMLPSPPFGLNRWGARAFNPAGQGRPVGDRPDSRISGLGVRWGAGVGSLGTWRRRRIVRGGVASCGRCSNDLRFARTSLCETCSSARGGTTCAMRWLRRAARQWRASSARSLGSALPTWFWFAVAREGVGFGGPAVAAVAAFECVCGEGGEGGVVDGVSEVVEGLGGAESVGRGANWLGERGGRG